MSQSNRRAGLLTLSLLNCWYFGMHEVVNYASSESYFAIHAVYNV